MTAPFPFLSFFGIPSSISIDDNSYPALEFPESTEIVFKPFSTKGYKKPHEYIATSCPSAASIMICLDTSTKNLDFSTAQSKLLKCKISLSFTLK